MYAYIKIRNINVELSNSTKSNASVNILYLDNIKDANSMNNQMLYELNDYLDSIKDLKNIRALIIEGKGRHFCSGIEISSMKDSSSSEIPILLNSFLKKLSTLPFPTIAKVRGLVIGGGIGIVCACDYSVSSHSSIFSLPELRLGLIPAIILPYLIQKIPNGYLNRMIISGDRIDSYTAQRYNIIEEIIDNKLLDNFIKEEINKLLFSSPSAFKKYKVYHAKYLKDPINYQSIAPDILQEIRLNKDAQNGLNNKEKHSLPEWVGSINI